MSSNEKQKKVRSVIEVLIEFINNIDPNLGWWYSIGEYKLEDNIDFEDLFLPLSQLFRIHRDAFNIFKIEANCLKYKGNKLILSMIDYDNMKSIVNNSMNVEVSKSRIGKFQQRMFLKIGNIDETPKTI